MRTLARRRFPTLLEFTLARRFMSRHLARCVVLLLSVGASAVVAQDQEKKTAPKADQPAADQAKKADAKAARPAPPSATVAAPRAGDGGWMRLHQQYLEKLKSGAAPEVVFLGDSITQGWGGAGKRVWDRFYAPRKALNLGIGGDRTQHVLWRIEHGEVEGIEPKALVLMIGTNNIGANPPEEIAQGIKLILEKLHEKLPRTKILLLSVFPRDPGPEGAKRKLVQSLNEKLAPLADGKSIVLLDIGARFLEPDGAIAKTTMPDHLHLSPKAYRDWAEAIEPTLREMIEGN